MIFIQKYLYKSSAGYNFAQHDREYDPKGKKYNLQGLKYH